MNLEHHGLPESKQKRERKKKWMEGCQRTKEPNSKSPQWPKLKEMSNKINNIVLNFNLTYKINIYVSILIPKKCLNN